MTNTENKCCPKCQTKAEMSAYWVCSGMCKCHTPTVNGGERVCENGHVMTGIGFCDECPEFEAPWKTPTPTVSWEDWEIEFDEKFSDLYKHFIESEVVVHYIGDYSPQIKSFIKDLLATKERTWREEMSGRFNKQGDALIDDLFTGEKREVFYKDTIRQLLSDLPEGCKHKAGFVKDSKVGSRCYCTECGKELLPEKGK